MQDRPAEETEHATAAPQALWPGRARLLWAQRRTLARTAVVAVALGVIVALLIPKRYESTASIMPPAPQPGQEMLMASLMAHTGVSSGLGSVAGNVFSAHTAGALFVDLLRSGTVTGHLMDRFNLQRVYGTRFRSDAAKKLAKRTAIVEDKKSGVITVTVQDHDPVRARDLANGYLDELNRIVQATSNSAAHEQRLFIERRLQVMTADLDNAETALSRFSSQSGAVDIKEQTRGTVDAAARVQAELIVEQANLSSLRRIYGDDNVRVRSGEARVATLRQQLGQLGGVAGDAPETGSSAAVSPPLRKLPQLAVPYEDLYRKVRLDEVVVDMLTQQAEAARIDEIKDVPVVNVIDAAGIPEKKSFPPRAAIVLGFLVFGELAAAAAILFRAHWSTVDASDERRLLAQEMRVAVAGLYPGHGKEGART